MTPEVRAFWWTVSVTVVVALVGGALVFALMLWVERATAEGSACNSQGPLRAYMIGQNALGQWVATEGTAPGGSREAALEGLAKIEFGATPEEALARIIQRCPPMLKPEWDPLWNQRR